MTKTHRESNPFPHSDSNKRYYAYEYWLRQTFGGKCAKIPLDIGLTCPNIDGRCGRGGCIYCSGRGSGDCALTPDVPLAEQYRQTREALGRKWSVERCIAYFQAHTNTYAPLDFLKKRRYNAWVSSSRCGAVGDVSERRRWRMLRGIRSGSRRRAQA